MIRLETVQLAYVCGVISGLTLLQKSFFKSLSTPQSTPTRSKRSCSRRIEDQHSLPQLVHILQLIVCHPDLFYPYRQQFVGVMITSLPKIGFVQNTSSENKKLSLQIVELIINWEQKRRHEMKVDSKKHVVPKKPEDQGWTPKIQHIEVTANFLIR